MTTTSTATLWAQADQSIKIRVKTVDGGSTPLTMTGYALQFVLRRTDAGEPVVFSYATGSGITIANGVEEDDSTPTGGTDDMAVVAVADTDFDTRPGNNYHGALWRTDNGSDNPLWQGPVIVKRAAAQV